VLDEYSSYANPFYAAPDPTAAQPAYLNYSQPVVNVVQALPQTGSEPPKVPETATQAFDTARAEFKQGNYRDALVKTEQAMKDFPADPVMHEFRALCLFALGDYRRASAAVHAILASGPGWDWTTLSSLYPDTDTYSGQLAALERRCTTNPDDGAAWFLLAYHYTTVGNAQGAKEALGKLHRLYPTDPVVTQLWEAAGGTDPAPATPPKAPPPPPDVDLDIVGNWAASRVDIL
jgi:predicted Zn-dependent protease